ncbi:hypothetical protein [Paenibacillus sp. NPDC058177]
MDAVPSSKKFVVIKELLHKGYNLTLLAIWLGYLEVVFTSG